MNINSGMREGLIVTAGALLGATTAGGLLAAHHADDSGSRKLANTIAAAGLGIAATFGVLALVSRNPGFRSDVMMGAIGFAGLPSVVATGMIQNHRDFG